MPKTVSQALAQARTVLGKACVADPQLDARLLLQHCLDCDHAALIGGHKRVLSQDEFSRFTSMVERRAVREPVSRILGYREFLGRRFEVSPHVLDPRPETELLVEMILEDHPGREEALRFADVGTGSGAIAVSLLAERRHWTALGTDTSAYALTAAARNAALLGMDSRFGLVECDLLASLEDRFDLIVSNPPYIESRQIDGLEPEVRDHDPAVALDGGEDGLEVYRRLFDAARNRLASDGKLYLEIGAGQEDGVSAIGFDAGWRLAGQVRDYAGHVRHLSFAP